MEETFNFLWAYRKYRPYVLDMLKIVPYENKEAITYALWRYETEFYVPPRDAFRSILRKIKRGDLLSTPPCVSGVMEEDIPKELR